MKEASLANNQKVIVGGVKFFLGGDREREELEDESSEDDNIDMNALRHQMGINKKTKKRSRELKKAASTVKKV
jgi:protein SDA1